jgi:hypothetical protein
MQISRVCILVSDSQMIRNSFSSVNGYRLRKGRSSVSRILRRISGKIRCSTFSARTFRKRRIALANFGLSAKKQIESGRKATKLAFWNLERRNTEGHEK